jgi:hypothetical protein
MQVGPRGHGADAEYVYEGLPRDQLDEHLPPGAAVPTPGAAAVEHVV